MIIGVTGTNASGKGVFCSVLKEKYGFTVHSLSDILREEAARKRVEPSKTNLIEIGNTLREKYGAGILAQQVKKRIAGKNVVVDSIRNPKEVAELRMLSGFTLIAIDAPLQIRYQREKSRGRLGDAKSFEEWVLLEEVQYDTNPLHLQLHETMKLADYTIINDGTSDEFMKKTEDFITELREKYSVSR